MISAMSRHITPTPWSYFLVRWSNSLLHSILFTRRLTWTSHFFLRLLFKFVLKVFYGSIVVENTHLIPSNGIPCIICANHSNSLTDALLIVTSVSRKQRNFMRLTAKATQFGRGTFTSWLIEAAGTLPIKRRKDTPDVDADNSETMEKLLQALDKGDAICFFPEGISRYHPTIAPLKTGVARLISDSLTRNKHKKFKLALLTCSITYMHREHFRSDVLITFHPPMTFSPQANNELLEPVNFAEIRALTSRMQNQISMGTFDSPSWEFIRISKLAARMYAPLGTLMSLGDFVRISKGFIEAFKWARGDASEKSMLFIGSEEEDEDLSQERSDWINQLRYDLKDYHDQLTKYHIKDDRVRRRVSQATLFWRIWVRFLWASLLSLLSVPGLLLWSPIFLTTRYAVHEFKKTGPIWDTWDEIAQYKLVYGFVSGVCVWLACIIFTLPIAPITSILVPVFMWISLRWFEDTVSAFRALVALTTLLYVGERPLRKLRDRRKDLHARVMVLATTILGLPQNPETYFAEKGGKEKGRVRGQWESDTKYFSLRRRRKRDWNETLKLYDKDDYPDESLFK